MVRWSTASSGFLVCKNTGEFIMGQHCCPMWTRPLGGTRPPVCLLKGLLLSVFSRLEDSPPPVMIGWMSSVLAALTPACWTAVSL